MNETNHLPTINFNDIHISINSNIAGTYLRKKNRRGFLQRRWFFIRFSLSAKENFCLEYSHKPLDGDSRQSYPLENASIISSNNKTFTLQAYKTDHTTTSIVLEADSKYHKEQWLYTLQHVINISNLRKQYLFNMIQQPAADTIINNSSLTKNNNDTTTDKQRILTIVKEKQRIKTPRSVNQSSSIQPKHTNEKKRQSHQASSNTNNTATHKDIIITNQKISQIIHKYHILSHDNNSKNNIHTTTTSTSIEMGTFRIYLIYNQYKVSLSIFDPSQLPLSKCHMLWPIDVMRAFGWLGTELELLMECICIIPHYRRHRRGSNRQSSSNNNNNNSVGNMKHDNNNNDDDDDDDDTSSSQPLYFQESIRFNHAIGIHASLLQPDVTYTLQCKDLRMDRLNQCSEDEENQIEKMFLECCGDKYNIINTTNNHNSNTKTTNANTSIKNKTTVLRSEVEKQKRHTIQNIKQQLEYRFSQFINMTDDDDDGDGNNNNSDSHRRLSSSSSSSSSSQQRLPLNEMDMLMSYKRKKCCYYDEVLYKYIRMLYHHSTAVGVTLLPDDDDDDDDDDDLNNGNINNTVNTTNKNNTTTTTTTAANNNNNTSNDSISYSEFCLLEAFWINSLL